MQPAVSIIVPIYNAQLHLRECLDSVRAQKYGDFEAILVNDGSTDGSCGIIDEYCRADSRFKSADQNNMGVAKARNTGIDMATGKYLLFLDADDMLGEDALMELMPAAFAYDLDMISMNINLIPYDKSYVSPTEKIEKDVLLERDKFLDSYLDDITQFTYICTVFKADIIRSNEIRFRTRFAEDILFNMQAILRCNRFWVTQRAHYFYRKTAAGLSDAFFSNRHLICERNKAVIQMLGISETTKCDILSSRQQHKLQRSIISYAGIRYWMLHRDMVKCEGVLNMLPKDTKLAVWGAGKRIISYISALLAPGLSRVVLVDNDKAKQGKTLSEIPIIAPEDMLGEQYSGYSNLILSKLYVLEFFAQMKDLGILRKFSDMRLDIGINGQYDMQIKAMDDLYEDILKCGIVVDYPGKKRAV